MSSRRINCLTLADSLPPSLLATHPPTPCPSFRRRSLLGGYKAHSEAVQASRRRNPEVAAAGARGRGAQPHDPPADDQEKNVSNPNPNPNPRKRSRTHNSVRKSRRLSDAPRESERMPGAELAGGGVGQTGASGGGARGGGGGGGGLARCQRVWKMVPQIKDKRPVWLRQYEVCTVILSVNPPPPGKKYVFGTDTWTPRGGCFFFVPQVKDKKARLVAEQHVIHMTTKLKSNL